MKISVVLPTYNPNIERLRATLAGLLAQSLPPYSWECVIVDNASSPQVDESWCRERLGATLRLVREPTPGLSHARLTGIRAAVAELVLFCDDDNVLAPDYLENAIRLMDENPEIGVAGGKSLPVYLTPPPEWFWTDLAPLGCREFGDAQKAFRGQDFQLERHYPEFAPIGAGMVFRKSSMENWSKSVGRSGVSDRKGKSLSSAGDCDMVLHALELGFGAAYWPELVLEHLLPRERLTKNYLGSISRAAYRDFVKVLGIHGICPWQAIPKWTVPLRVLKAWIAFQAWKGPVNWIRWQAAIGQFEGRAALSQI